MQTKPTADVLTAERNADNPQLLSYCRNYPESAAAEIAVLRKQAALAPELADALRKIVATAPLEFVSQKARALLAKLDAGAEQPIADKTPATALCGAGRGQL